MDLPILSLPTPIQLLEDDTTRRTGVKLYLKRDDLIHPAISGNKWRKLKYVLADARQQHFTSVLTFGGARSNHLYATAAAGAVLGLRTIGIVRGEEYQEATTDTLRFCRDQGMHIHAVSRTEYRLRSDTVYQEKLSTLFGNPYMIPEGGTTPLALAGVREMVEEVKNQLEEMPEYFATAIGTGGTAAGILSAGIGEVLAFSSLKGGDFLQDEISKLVDEESTSSRLRLFTGYHFGGYAKSSPELLQFMEEFEQRHELLLEHVYTGKMLFGLYDLLKKGYFQPGATVVAVHTGGLQGRLS